MKEYLESVEEVLKEQNSSEEGLSSQEAEKGLLNLEETAWKKGKRIPC